MSTMVIQITTDKELQS